MPETVRTMGDKLRDALAEIHAQRPEVIGCYAAPPKQLADGHMYCEIYECDEDGEPIGEVLEVVRFV